MSVSSHSQGEISAYLDLWSGGHGLLVGGYNADVEESRKDKDQTGSSGSPWAHRGGTINHSLIC